MADYSKGAAADDLETGGDTGETLETPTKETPEAGESTESEREDTWFIDDFPGSENLQPGDTITLRVVGKDKSGALEVEQVAGGPEGEPDWKQDLRRSVETTPGPEMAGGPPPAPGMMM